MRKTIVFISILQIISINVYSQTKQDRIKISSYSNKTGNNNLREVLTKEERDRKSRLNNFLLNNPNYNFKKTNEDFSVEELVDVKPNGEKIYARTYNEGAAITARANKLYSGGSLGINIQGQNMIVGVWDGGTARETHQEFMNGTSSKVLNKDGAAYDNHPTHVMGTILAKGVVPEIRGIAFNASGFSYDWNNDLNEIAYEASEGLLASNHSYGFGALSSIWFFGAYDSRAQSFDEICYNNPFYLPVIAAGNNRNDTTAPGSVQIGNKLGYDMIFGHANAKNVITVAAVNEVTNYVDESSVTMSSFSSWGPSDDGRIKPDISTKGVNVKSTLSSSDTATGFMSGTSMAAPGITGVVLLLQQYYRQLNLNYMKAATVKGLILHTADEAGDDNGPDYKFGWGLVNAEKAALTIKNRNSNTANKSVIDELTLNNNAVYTKTINASGSSPLKVSISWTDPKSPTVNSGVTDPSTKYLVNDLDVKITKNTTTYYPWKLQGMSAAFDPATNNSPNNVDNFERVDINNPSGTYTITVTHKGTLVNGSQNFSLIVTSDNLSTLSTNETSMLSNEKIDFYPNPGKNFIKISGDKIKSDVSIHDLSGRLIIKTSLDDNTLDIRNLLKGNYIMNFKDSKGNFKSIKFIKE